MTTSELKTEMTIFTLLLLGTVLATTGTHAAYLSCANNYKIRFQQILGLKDTVCKEVHFKDCGQVGELARMILPGVNAASGVYTLDNVCNQNSFQEQQARCDIDQDGGWLVILRRQRDVPEQVDFNRTRDEYKDGFGDLKTEFWYGLKNIHCLTSYEDVELKIELKNDSGNGVTWLYREFKVDGPKTSYTLTIGDAEELTNTNGEDAMFYHNGRQFSTIDEDHDARGGNCAEWFGGGGWWYNNCHSTLTGSHTNGRVVWYTIATDEVYYPNVEMKIKFKSGKAPLCD